MSCYESQDVIGSAERVTEGGEMLHDTREKLEEDVRNVMSQWMFETGWTGNTAHGLHEHVVMRWLDRQASITERETLHSHPMCAGSDAYPALNRSISESADRETPDTAGIGASKDEIRDFDVWNVAYEIYCAGGYVDNGSEPNPPTDGIRELLERQAAITGREWMAYREVLVRENCDQVDELTAERDQWRDAYEDSERLRLELVKDLEHARRWSDKWRDLVHRYEGLCDGLLDERDRLWGDA